MIFYENKNFIRHLDSWLSHSDQSSARWLDSYGNKIPSMFLTYNYKLYRGFTLDKMPAGNIDIKEYTSWSKDKNTAINFLKYPKFKISNKQGVKVLASKIFTSTKVVLNIYDLAMFLGKRAMIDLGIDDLAVDSAFKEQEVLIKPVTLSASELTIIK